MPSILNFSHPLTPAQMESITTTLKEPIRTVSDILVQFDSDREFLPQVRELLDQSGVTSEQFQSEAWLVVPPALSYIAVIILAELHGRMGHFPTIIRLKPKVDALVTTFDFAEIINLEHVRQNARTRR